MVYDYKIKFKDAEKDDMCINKCLELNISESPNTLVFRSAEVDASGDFPMVAVVPIDSIKYVTSTKL